MLAPYARHESSQFAAWTLNDATIRNKLCRHCERRSCAAKQTRATMDPGFLRRGEAPRNDGCTVERPIEAARYAPGTCPRMQALMNCP
jgi:hypothetical protein